MHEPPPVQLTELLQRLGLATARDLHSVEGTVRRLAGDLPQFQSVWIDALRQARLLTHFQAAEIMAERGDGLRVGPFVLCQIVQECGFATVYKAEDIESHEPVRLVVVSIAASEDESLLAQLENLAVLGKRLPQLSGLVEWVGQDGARCWAASRWVEGTSLAEWMLHHGRFPPEIVLEVARAMASDLAAMEAVGIVHGDIRIENVLLLPDGGVCLPQPGLRGIIRPHEGIAHGDLAPEACGTLAPERVAGGAPPTVASDLFACGCVWWQMLCGRPPLGGGDTMSRLCAAQTAAIEDWRHWANDVPKPLGDAVTSCLKKDPHDRPSVMAALAKQLGPPRRSGRPAIAACIQAAARPHAPWLAAKRARAKKGHPHLWTATTLAALAAVAVAWPLWVAANRPRAADRMVSRNDKRPERDATEQKSAPLANTNNGYHAAIPRDTAVMQAGFSDSLAKPQAVDGIAVDPSFVVRLPSNGAVRADALQLKPGQTVRPESGRCRVAVPAGGLAVLADRVSFENIDFVPEEPAATSADRERENSTLVNVSSPECAFVGCSFQSAIGRPELSAGITWDGLAAGQGAAALLPSGRMRVKDCVFRRVAAGIVLRARGANNLAIDNTLHLGPGPMIRLSRRPAADEPLRIALTQVTLRGAEALVDCHFAGDNETAAGEIGIAASGCVFAPREDAALLQISCDASPERMLREVKWTGQGAVLAPRVVFARWTPRAGAAQAVDDATISISGLVRGQVEFAARFDGNPANSRILDCQAPLADSDSLGANTNRLPPDVEIENDRRR